MSKSSSSSTIALSFLWRLSSCNGMSSMRNSGSRIFPDLGYDRSGEAFRELGSDAARSACSRRLPRSNASRAFLRLNLPCSSPLSPSSSVMTGGVPLSDGVLLMAGLGRGKELESKALWICAVCWGVKSGSSDLSLSSRGVNRSLLIGGCQRPPPTGVALPLFSGDSSAPDGGGEPLRGKGRSM